MHQDGEEGPVRFEERWSLSDAVSAALAPLTRPGWLDVIEAVEEADGEGILASEIEPRLDLGARSHSSRLIYELARARAITVEPDKLDARRRRISATANALYLMALGKGLSAWVASTQIPREPLRLLIAVWSTGLASELHSAPLTVAEAAARLDFSEYRLRHFVDRCLKCDLIAKTPMPDGRKRLSLASSFGRHIPSAARMVDYLRRGFGLEPDFLSERSIRTALGELVKSLSSEVGDLPRITLSVSGSPTTGAKVSGHFEDRELSRFKPGEIDGPAIESDLEGWIAFLAGQGRNSMTWGGRGARSLIEAIDRLARS